MKLNRLALAACGLLAVAALAAGPAAAAPTVFNAYGQPYTPLYGCDQLTALSAANALCAADAYNAPFSGAIAMTSDGTTYAAGRSLEAICTVGGNVTLTFADASTLTIALAVGDQIRPYAVTKWTVGGVTGPATCTYSNLK